MTLAAQVTDLDDGVLDELALHVKRVLDHIRCSTIHLNAQNGRKGDRHPGTQVPVWIVQSQIGEVVVGETLARTGNVTRHVQSQRRDLLYIKDAGPGAYRPLVGGTPGDSETRR